MVSRKSAIETMLLVGLVVIATGLVAYGTLFPKTIRVEYSGNGQVAPGTLPINSTGELRKFSSNSELLGFLSSNSQSSSRGGGNILTKNLVSLGAAPQAESLDGAGSSGKASGYSETNVQYEGIDEGDFVKTDGRFIYVISGRVLSIIRAEDLKSVSNLTIGNLSDWSSPKPVEVFVSGGKLVLFTEENEKEFQFSMYDIRPYPRYSPFVRATVFDVSDAENPREISDFSVSGSYYQSRMSGDVAYLVTQEYTGNDYPGPILYKTGGVRLVPETYYFDKAEDSYVVNSVSSFSVKTGEVIDLKAFLLGYANTLMVSENAIYIATDAAMPYYRCLGWGRCYGGWEERASERFYTVVMPLLPEPLRGQVSEIALSSRTESEKWGNISVALSEFFGKVESEEELQKRYESTFSAIEDALEEYDAKEALKYQETIVHKILIDDGKIEYSSKGTVLGKMLNQFSLDESGGKLRVATTVSYWAKGESVRYNNVYVLNSGMETVGKLENISSGESIFSTRFIGDRLYMVTFRQTDPLFVIDLSGENPKILGELKIPGFSNYLHPFDSETIIGIGKETEERANGGFDVKGLKIALFDVSDVSNPKVLDKVEIGMPGTDSAALHDHKAFLFSKELGGLLVLPVTEVTGKEKSGPYEYQYTYGVWEGAYAFNLSRDGGIVELGKVTHSSRDSDYYYWSGGSSVRRSLYIGEALYTVSSSEIISSDLSDGLRKTGEIELPPAYETGYYYDGGPMPADSKAPEILKKEQVEKQAKAEVVVSG